MFNSHHGGLSLQCSLFNKACISGLAVGNGMKEWVWGEVSSQMALDVPSDWDSTDEGNLFCSCLDSKRDIGLSRSYVTFLEKRNQSSHTGLPSWTEPVLIRPREPCSCYIATCPTHHIPSRCRSPQTRRGRAGICRWRRSSQRAGRCTSHPAEEEGAEAQGGPTPAPTVRCAGLACSEETFGS